MLNDLFHHLVLLVFFLLVAMFAAFVLFVLFRVNNDKVVVDFIIRIRAARAHILIVLIFNLICLLGDGLGSTSHIFVDLGDE